MITELLPEYETRLVGYDHPGWDEYVLSHPKGSIFHTQAMIEAYGLTRGVTPIAHAATDNAGRIVAILVGYHVNTIVGFGSYASRLLQFAEPLCDATPLGTAMLGRLIDLHDQKMHPHALLSEVRSIQAPGPEKGVLVTRGYQYNDYLNYLIDTRRSRDELWNNIRPRLRQKIRSSRRKGVEVRTDTSLEGVKRLHRMLRYSYARARVPLLGEDLFENALEKLPAGAFRIRTAFRGDEPVASVCSLLFKDRLISWYGGTKRIRGISPFACIVWDDIAFGHEQGFATYDFGGAGHPGANYGPRRFKASFGGDEVQHGRYTLTYSQWRLRLAFLCYSVSRGLGAWSSGGRS